MHVQTKISHCHSFANGMKIRGKEIFKLIIINVTLKPFIFHVSFLFEWIFCDFSKHIYKISHIA